MATPIGRPVSPTYTAATPPAARVEQPASTPPALETSKPVQTQASFAAARQSVVGKSTETVNPSQGGAQVKQELASMDPHSLLVQGQKLMAIDTIAQEFSSGTEVTDTKPKRSSVSGAQSVTAFGHADLTVMSGVDDAIKTKYENVINTWKAEGGNIGNAGSLNTLTQALATKIFTELGIDSPSVELAAAVKNTFGSLVKTLGSAEALIQPQIQGLGGENGGEDQGSGAAGHYVNSPMSCIHHMIESRKEGAKDVLESVNTLLAVPSANLHGNLQADMPSIIRGTLQEVAFPETINQHARSTCAATTTQIQLAIETPQKYVNLVYDLVTKDLDKKSGTGLVLLAEDFADDQSGRSFSSRLIQDAFMQKGYEVDADQAYQNAKEGGGLSEIQLKHLMTAVFGGQFESVKLDDHGSYDVTERDAFFGKIEAQLKAGKMVPVSIDMFEQGALYHKLLITAMDQNNVHFINPWGELQSIPLEAAQKTFCRAQFTQNLPPDPSNEVGATNCLRKLVGPSKDLASYRPMPWTKYATYPVMSRAQFDQRLAALGFPDLNKLKYSELEVLAAEDDGLTELDSGTLGKFVALLEKDPNSEILHKLKSDIKAKTDTVTDETEANDKSEAIGEIIGLIYDAYYAFTDQEESKKTLADLGFSDLEKLRFSPQELDQNEDTELNRIDNEMLMDLTSVLNKAEDKPEIVEQLKTAIKQRTDTVVGATTVQSKSDFIAEIRELISQANQACQD